MADQPGNESFPTSIPIPVADGGTGSATLGGDIATNNAHRTGNGSDHADVASNTALTAQATTTARGTVELATAAEVTTGTDTDRAITPDALANSAPTFDGSNLTNLPGGVTLPVPDARWSADNMRGGRVLQVHDLADVANLKTAGDGPASGLWVYESNLLTASISGGVMLIKPTSGGNRRWGIFSGTSYWTEAPWRRWVIQRTADGVVYPVTVIMHCRSDAAVSGAFESGGIGVCTDSDTPGVAGHARLIVGNYGSAEQITADDSVGTSSSALTDTEVGAWLRMTIYPNGTIQSDAKDGAGSKPANDEWTAVRTHPARFASDDVNVRLVPAILEDTSAGRGWEIGYIEIVAPGLAAV